jgi:hypothetical protein
MKNYTRVTIEITDEDSIVHTKHMNFNISLKIDDSVLIEKFTSKSRGWKSAGNKLHDMCVNYFLDKNFSSSR